MTLTPHPRQAAFAMPNNRFRPLVLEDVRWAVYDNANFSVHIADQCNAACPFCIAHLRYLSEGRVYLKPQITDDERYLTRLETVLSAVAPAQPSVSITGGEPTIHPRLPAILKVLAAAGVRKRTLTTNATGLLQSLPGHTDTVLAQLAKHGLAYLNISRAHFDTAHNNALMRLAPALLPDGLLRESIGEARRSGMRVRLSCVLLKSGIHTVTDIKRYLDWAEDMGVDNVIFRQLMDFDPTQAVDDEIPRFCAENTIGLAHLWAALDADPGFSLQHTLRGYYYYVEVRRYGSMDVVTEQADLRCISGELKRFSQQLAAPVAFEMVFHPNGNLCAGWHEDERIMMEWRDG